MNPGAQACNSRNQTPSRFAGMSGPSRTLPGAWLPGVSNKFGLSLAPAGGRRRLWEVCVRMTGSAEALAT